MRFTKDTYGQPIYTAISVARIGERAHTINIRIDGRDGSYRVDRLSYGSFYWEAIDGGQGFPTVRLAKLWAKHWVGQATKQATLTPRTARENLGI